MSLEARHVQWERHFGPYVVQSSISDELHKLLLKGANKVRKNKYTIIAMHPGYVKTKSGGNNADYTIEYASQKLYKTIVNLSKEDNGKFLDLKGKKIQW